MYVGVIIKKKENEQANREINPLNGFIILEELTINQEVYYKRIPVPDELPPNYSELIILGDKYLIFEKDPEMGDLNTLKPYSITDKSYIKLRGNYKNMYKWYEQNGLAIAEDTSNRECCTYVFTKNKQHEIEFAKNIEVRFYYETHFVIKLDENRRYITHVYDLRNENLYKMQNPVCDCVDLEIIPKSEGGFVFFESSRGILYNENGIKM